MTIAVITGASSGIGREFVRQIANKYRNITEIWAIARREDRLEELKLEVDSNTIKVRPIVCDLTNDRHLLEYKNLLIKYKPSIRVLVNAAGFGIIGKFNEIDFNDNVGMCDLNITALTKMISLSLPYMNRNKSNIINLASSAAFLPQPSFAVYAATKSYVLSLSTALNKELKDKRVTVTAVCPGPVDTEFFDIAEKNTSVKLYKKIFKTKADKVVSLALKDAFHGCYISVYGFSMKAFRFICKVLPKNFIIKFVK